MPRRVHDVVFHWVNPDGYSARVSGRVMLLAPGLGNFMYQSRFTRRVDVPFPRWIIRRLVVWLRRYESHHTDLRFQGETEFPVAGDLTDYDRDLDTGALLNLMTLNACGLYLKIPRLIYVTDALMEDRMRGRSPPEGVSYDENLTSGHYRDFNYLIQQVRNNL